MKKQIEEMAEIIYDSVDVDNPCLDEKYGGFSCFGCDYIDKGYCQHDIERARALYNAGYRKQREGCDFCNAGSEKCGTCVKFFDYYEDGGSDRCSSEYGNEKCAYYKPVHYCSNCGAHMSGGKTDYRYGCKCKGYSIANMKGGEG